MRQPQRLWIVLALIHGLLYSALTPPWQGPDEIAHFEYAYLLARHGRPLTYADASPELEQAIIRSLYAHQAWRYVRREAPAQVPARLAEADFFSRSRTLDRFSLTYVPYALAVRPFLGQSVVGQLYAMRLVSVLMGALMVALAWQMARLLEPGNRWLAHGAAAFVLLLPQHAFVFGVVSDGHLAELLATVTLYLLLGLRRHGFTWQRLLGAALAGLGAVFAKTTAYFLVPLALILGLAWLLAWLRQPRGQLLRRLRPPAVLASVALGALLIALPLAVLPAVSAHPLSMLSQVLAEGAAPGGFAAHIVAVTTQGLLQRAVLGTFKSFWATFGWMAAPLTGGWYAALGLACILSASGWVYQLRRRRAVPGGYALLALAAALSLAILFGWFLLSPLGIYGYQGRYLFAVVVPVALLLVRGWLWLVPDRWAGRALAVSVAGLVVLDSAAVALVLVPFFHG